MEDLQSWKFLFYIVTGLLSCFLSLFIMIFLTAKKNRSRQHKKGVLYFSFILAISIIASVLPFIDVEDQQIKNVIDNSLFIFPILFIVSYSWAFNYTFKKRIPGKNQRKTKRKITTA
jgi:prolipoprotein diacylglyceryltransferase